MPMSMTNWAWNSYDGDTPPRQPSREDIGKAGCRTAQPTRLSSSWCKPSRAKLPMSGTERYHILGQVTAQAMRGVNGPAARSNDRGGSDLGV